MKLIPKFQRKGKLPQIKIGNKWVDLESKGNGEFTAGGRSYKVDSKPVSATENKELVVTPKRNKIVDKDKVKENNKKAMSQHRSAFNGNDILYPIKKGFDVVSKGLYSLGQGIERAASQTSPYGSIRPTNPNWMEAPTPLTDATFQYVLPTMMPSRWVGTIRTGKAPWNPENPGLGDEDTNLLFDIGASGPFMKGVGKATKASVKTGKAIGQTAANAIDYISKNYEIVPVKAPWYGSLKMGVFPDKLPKFQFKNYITPTELVNQAKFILSDEALIKQPYFRKMIENNPELKEFVTKISKGENVELPLFINTGIKPNLGTVLEVIKESKTRGLPATQKFGTTLKGGQRIKGEYFNHKDFGGYEYSASGEGAADNAYIKYGDVGRPWDASLKLLEEGYDPTTPQYQYVIDFYKTIDELQKKYGFKWGADTRKLEKWSWKPALEGTPSKSDLRKRIDPHARTSKGEELESPEIIGLSQISIPKTVMSDIDKANYIDAMHNISQFWGSGEFGRNMGGVHQQALTLPDANIRSFIRLPKPSGYKDLYLGTYYPSIRANGIPLTKFFDLKPGQAITINQIASELRKLKTPYFDVNNLYDPYLGTTHAISRPRVILGLEKGDKINVQQNKSDK